MNDDLSPQLADETERAQLSADAFVREALERHLAASRKPLVFHSHCKDCGDALSEARLIASPGCDTCTPCADLREIDEFNRRRLGARLR